MEQAGRVKLNELHVRHRHARAVGHGHAVARRNARVRGVEINLPAAARGQQHLTGGERLDPPGFHVEHINAHATVVRAEAEFAPRDQVDRRVIFKHLHVRMQRQRRQQRLLDLPPRHILGVEDAPLRVTALLAEIELMLAAVFPFAKRHAEFDQLPDPRRALLHNPAHHLFTAETRPAFQRVAHVQVEGVLGRGYTGDSALRVIRVRLRPVLLRDHRHRPLLRHIQRKGQPGDARAEHEIIVTMIRSHGPTCSQFGVA